MTVARSQEDVTPAQKVDVVSSDGHVHFPNLRETPLNHTRLRSKLCRRELVKDDRHVTLTNLLEQRKDCSKSTFAVDLFKQASSMIQHATLSVGHSMTPELSGRRTVCPAMSPASAAADVDEDT